MSLQDHVPSLKLCRQWKQAGGRQDTEFVWNVFGGRTLPTISPRRDIETTTFEQVAAPLDGEMLEWLKDKIGDVWFADGLWIVEPWVSRAGFEGYRNKSLAYALMKMCLWRKENEK